MGDSYRPNNRRPARRDNRYSPPPSLGDRVTFVGNSNGHNGRGESYRPDNRNGGRSAANDSFTFTAGSRAPQFPTGPANASDRAVRRKPNNRGGSYNYNDRRPYQNGGWNGARKKKEAPHERALLQSRDDTTEQSFVKDGSNRFNLDNLSDDMDLESGSSDDEGGKHKNSRKQSDERADGDSVPKWCNPDPYTTLPPPETGKRVDVVKLIRKAKNDAAEKASATNAVAANDDFISFGGDGVLETPLNQLPAPAVMPSAPPTAPSKRSTTEAGISGPSRKHGKKRAHEESDATLVAQISPEWRPTGNGPGSNVPWTNNNDYSHLKDDAKKWLHNEILDFYDYVVATDHEHKVREAIVRRVSDAMGRRQLDWPDASIQSFGSFPTGLYLPAADMDLVYISDIFFKGGYEAFQPSKNQLYRVGRALVSKGIARDLIVIAKAKVPIIKFVDTVTGIPVDISFENRSGIDAQYYFNSWKKEYPDMIYLVALIKQFLLMRDLNEVANQGLGGFSIICLAVNMLMRRPTTNNIGELFLDFLDYYGNRFDLATQRIIMKEPYVVDKGEYGIDGRKEKPDGLSIQDPNRPDNNISGGSFRVKEIFQMFSQAHESISKRIEAVGNGTFSGSSILEPVFGGNYQIYDKHRARLRQFNLDDLDSQTADSSGQTLDSAPRGSSLARGSSRSRGSSRPPRGSGQKRDSSATRGSGATRGPSGPARGSSTARASNRANRASNRQTRASSRQPDGSSSRPIDVDKTSRRSRKNKKRGTSSRPIEVD